MGGPLNGRLFFVAFGMSILDLLGTILTCPKKEVITDELDGKQFFHAIEKPHVED